jgi:hypothetical protein
VHHLHGAAGQPEGHGPDGPPPGPVHQIVHFRYHKLRRLRKSRRRGRGRWGPRIGSRGAGAGGEPRHAGVEGEGALGRQREWEPRRGSG